MVKRTDLHSILIIGAGPIIIGQACEFDYSGTQGVLSLKEEGYRIILVNSNPATIMTDPKLADMIYFDPLNVDSLEKIIAHERPDALLPTLGGQTALNLALALSKAGILEKYGVELIGANVTAIESAEDRALFRQKMLEIGLEVPKSITATTLDEALLAQKVIGFPVMVRSSFTLGGKGCGIAYDQQQLIELLQAAFEASPLQTIILDEALIGWKEFEMEVVRDKNDNCMLICSIENIDPMGVHTGDSMTVSPAQTLSDKEYQKMRESAFQVLRAIGVETGGSNVQFAVNPADGRMLVIEMNPRVSRSSALASKATGYPIAKIAAKLAVGYTLEELYSDLTGISAAFEPTLDYIVVKLPRFHFDKFPSQKDQLGPKMRSVGEVMAMGRTFEEALLKAMRSLENSPEPSTFQPLCIPTSSRLWHLFEVFSSSKDPNELLVEVHAETHIDPWFLQKIQELALTDFSKDDLFTLKRKGFSDAIIAEKWGCSEKEVRKLRKEKAIFPVFKRIDGCAAEFPTAMPTFYSTYEQHCEGRPTKNPKIVVLGSGANRIGQGIEFDYCCVHAVEALREKGYETIMINCNPETVSTDYTCADRLYFSPLTVEDILAIIEMEQPLGVLVQYGGQTPLNCAHALETEGVNLLGCSAHLIDLTENRASFKTFLDELSLKQPKNIILHDKEAPSLDFPVIVRPSFVLGGKGMSIVHDEKALKAFLQKSSHFPLLIEEFLQDAIEVDIDAISDGTDVFIPAIMEHVEPAGIHSGDSACTIPPIHLPLDIQKELKKQTTAIVLALGIKGLINVQFAIQKEIIYTLEVNPRASRTVPFVSKALNIDLVKIATLCVLGEKLPKICLPESENYYVKEAVLPFSTFGEFALGPEMKATGEVIGIGKTFEEAYQKAQIAAGYL
jgi:carbamoyl-phosphate synthase large subunit